MNPSPQGQSEGRLMQVTIHNVPDAVHQELKARAKGRGLSLQNYMLNLLNEMAAEPSIDELIARSAALRAEPSPEPRQS